MINNEERKIEFNTAAIKLSTFIFHETEKKTTHVRVYTGVTPLCLGNETESSES